MNNFVEFFYNNNLNNIEVEYNKSLDWIYSFTNLEIDRSKKKFEDNYKLKKIQYLLENLGNPHNNKFIIHITGTKGKGSVSNILNKILIDNGYKVGLYTSPHIYEVTERIKINDIDIPKDRFVFYCKRIKNIVDKIEDKNLIPTFFDILTAIAFIYFHDENCQIWVVEVGIGGTYDSTNIVSSSLSIITSISKDHINILGNTLEEIALQKAGIIKDNKPVVLGKMRKKILELIKNEAKIKNSEVIYSQNLYKFKLKKFIISENYNDYENEYKNDKGKDEDKIILFDMFQLFQEVYCNKINFLSSLLGTFQINNFSIIFSSIDTLNKYYNFNFKINYNIFKSIFFAGRFNFFKIYYKGKTINIIIDGAHNGDSAKYFAESINLLYKENILNSTNNLLVIGMMSDKDHKNILKEVVFLANNIFLVEPDKYKDCKIENYESILLKIKHDSQKYIKIKSDFNIEARNIILNNDDYGNFIYKMNPYKVDFIKSIIDLYYNIYKDLPDNIYFTGSLYLASLILKDIEKIKIKA